MRHKIQYKHITKLHQEHNSLGDVLSTPSGSGCIIDDNEVLQ